MNLRRFSFGPSVERVFKTDLTFCVAFGEGKKAERQHVTSDEAEVHDDDLRLDWVLRAEEDPRSCVSVLQNKSA